MLPNCEGKEVRGSEGLRIGKVVRCDEEGIVIESGVFKVHDFAIPADEVATITEKEIYLRRPAEQYRSDAPHSHWSPWHTGKRDAEGRREMEALKRADAEHRLGAQGIEELHEQARTSFVPGDESETEIVREDRLAGISGTEPYDPLTAEKPLGSPPEARLPPAEHPEDEDWP